MLWATFMKNSAAPLTVRYPPNMTIKIMKVAQTAMGVEKIPSVP